MQHVSSKRERGTSKSDSFRLILSKVSCMWKVEATQKWNRRGTYYRTLWKWTCFNISHPTEQNVRELSYTKCMVC